MNSVFTKIIKGEIPSYKVAEDSSHLAFLDIAPIKIGHVLVIPKKQTDKVFDLSPSDFTALMNFSYQVAKSLEKVISAKRISMAIMGIEVPHAHIHLVPIDCESDLDFSRPRISLNSEEFKKISIELKKAYNLNYGRFILG